eukprot:3275209-Prymnesium_polylepis.1
MTHTHTTNKAGRGAKCAAQTELHAHVPCRPSRPKAPERISRTIRPRSIDCSYACHSLAAIGPS